MIATARFRHRFCTDFGAERLIPTFLMQLYKKHKVHHPPRTPSELPEYHQITFKIEKQIQNQVYFGAGGSTPHVGASLFKACALPPTPGPLGGLRLPKIHLLPWRAKRPQNFQRPRTGVVASRYQTKLINTLRSSAIRTLVNCVQWLVFATYPWAL